MSRLESVLAAATFFLLAEGTVAGSLVELHLAEITSVSVSAQVQRYEPLPGLAPERLEKKIRSKAIKIISTKGLRVKQSSAKRFVIEVKYERGKPPEGPGALLVRFELREPVVCSVCEGAEAQRTFEAVTWAADYLTTSSPKKAPEEILTALEFWAAEFADEVIQAQYYIDKAKHPEGNGGT